VCVHAWAFVLTSVCLAARVLTWCSVSAKTHVCVFTSGATAALKLVGEHFPFGPSSVLAHTQDNHTSAVGIREYALSARATVAVISRDGGLVSAYGHREPSDAESARGSADGGGSDTDHAPSLFVMPAESNFSGEHHSLGSGASGRSV
jgi:molybdenum cofactor sulfurtransferase